jgi:hypothetical protein
VRGIENLHPLAGRWKEFSYLALVKDEEGEPPRLSHHDKLTSSGLISVYI